MLTIKKRMMLPCDAVSQDHHRARRRDLWCDPRDDRREYDSDKLKTVIIELRRNLYNVSKEKAAFDMIGKAYYSLKFGRDAEGNLDINEVIQKLQEQLETVTIIRDDKDPAILGEAVISNKASVNKIFSDAKNVNDSFILKTAGKHLTG